MNAIDKIKRCCVLDQRSGKTEFAVNLAQAINGE